MAEQWILTQNNLGLSVAGSVCQPVSGRQRTPTFPGEQHSSCVSFAPMQICGDQWIEPRSWSPFNGSPESSENVPALQRCIVADQFSFEGLTTVAAVPGSLLQLPRSSARLFCGCCGWCSQKRLLAQARELAGSGWKQQENPAWHRSPGPTDILTKHESGLASQETRKSVLVWPEDCGTGTV